MACTKVHRTRYQGMCSAEQKQIFRTAPKQNNWGFIAPAY